MNQSLTVSPATLNRGMGFKPVQTARPSQGTILAILFSIALSFAATARGEKGQWTPISDDVISQLEKSGKKVGYPGLTAGVAVDPASGDVYMVVCDQGLWKSTDAGKTFTRIDHNTIGGRCETGFALDFDPAGSRLACFMIYGSCASTPDAAATWTAWKTNHLDFGAVDWEATGKALLAIRHESGGILCVSKDGGQTWKNLGKTGPDTKIVKEDRDYKGLGMFDASTLVASRGAGILRSTDGGTTWAQVSDAKLAAPVMRVHKGVGYWMSEKGLLASKDKGATWAIVNPVKAVFGPYFGKDGQHMIVVGKEGFSESTDGGLTWKVAAPLPPSFTVALVGPNYAWDSIHNIFYASSMGKPTYKFER
jgi:photosystem II stability/assembly factor-like uncharacterized protein